MRCMMKVLARFMTGRDNPALPCCMVWLLSLSRPRDKHAAMPGIDERDIAPDFYALAVGNPTYQP